MSESTILPLHELRRIREERQAARERADAERAGGAAAMQIVDQQESIDWGSFWATLDKRIWTALDMALAEHVAKAVAPLEARLVALERQLRELQQERR
jgi:hypothetical protein